MGDMGETEDVTGGGGDLEVEDGGADDAVDVMGVWEFEVEETMTEGIEDVETV
jgi:hypothetical protein